MSIFSRLKRSKKAAKQHKQKVSEQLNSEAVPKTPYKHIPTHAAVDALTGAPSSWKHDDRPKILEQHKRRSMMNMSRAGSALSTRPDYHTPAVPSLLRNSYYSNYNPTWNDRGDYSYLNEPYQKRRVSRNPSFIDSGIGPSPLASSAGSKQGADASPTSSSNSSLTDDNLEIPPSQRPQPRMTTNVYTQEDIIDSLHTSTIRKVGEAPISSSPPVTTSAPVVPPLLKPEKQQKKRWMVKGKNREIGVAA